ncbi:hypothetical protein HDC92_002497 [Pedobacter sp. AK017]|uniref:hypothetical protein n=1 Tax=Pedobacter sp. AK017 TaxID=2723073 RepID=UPI00161032B0|nr:hypothetical protein [Pedobacter sp. AK017]MBB5438816.1 hypothetical protein [Pedobacter sp. AK017]
MVIVINKETDEKEIKAALKKISKDPKKPKLADFFGALPDVFGDGLKYQKKVRSEWD